MEILEAGSGNGALTLHLARAIHAANPPLPRQQTTTDSGPTEKYPSVMKTDGSVSEHVGVSAAVPDVSESENAFKNLHDRNAIIHSIDISPKYSKHAEKNVQGFRRGLYSNDVDFLVGDVSDWVDEQLAGRSSNNPDSVGNAFLSHIFLDLPSSHDHAAKLASVLHVDGNLLVFAPSVTQLVRWVDEIRKKKLPLLMNQVLELSGGRPWDLRAVIPRNLLHESFQKIANSCSVSETENHDNSSPFSTIRDRLEDKEATAEASQVPMVDSSGWQMVCRPHMERTRMGGGFVGMWKKTMTF